MIIRVADKYRVVSPTGGTIGTFDTHTEAKKAQQRALFGRRHEHPRTTQGASSSETNE
jgi:hypothetical protein